MATDSSRGELSSVFAHRHVMFLTAHDATTAVRQLARAVHRVLPSADGTGDSLLDGTGTRVATAATDTVVEDADILQYELEQARARARRAAEVAAEVLDAEQDQWR